MKNLTITPDNESAKKDSPAHIARYIAFNLFIQQYAESATSREEREPALMALAASNNI